MEHEPNDISRRKLLKRIGAGAAIAWSAPILTSLRVPAFAAAVSGSCTGCSCQYLINPSGCHGDSSCFCDQIIDSEGGACFCDNNTTFNDGCTSNAQCAGITAGAVCIKTDCSGGTSCTVACGSLGPQGATRRR